MANRLIESDLQQQMLRCRLCRELVEIPRRVVRDPEALLSLVEETQRDHRECAEYPDNPTLAAAARRVRKSLEAEFRKAAAPSRRRRCQG